MTTVAEYLEPKANDIKMLVLAETHISSRKVEPGMATYVYGKADLAYSDYVGCSLIDLQKTWDKLVLAARVLAAVQDPKGIYCVGQRLYAQRAIIKFAKIIDATAAPGRFTPGQFTNSRTKCFVEPRVLLVADPRTDSQAVKEASYVNIPTIAFCGADSSLQYIDIAIPGNNRCKESLGLLYWLLAREVQRIRGFVLRDGQYSVPVDLFFYKDPEELEKLQEEMGEAAFQQEQPYDAQEFNEFDQGTYQDYETQGAVVGAVAEQGAVVEDWAQGGPVGPDTGLQQGTNWNQPFDEQQAALDTEWGAPQQQTWQQPQAPQAQAQAQPQQGYYGQQQAQTLEDWDA